MITSSYRDRLGVAVVGYGYWGPNLVRNVLDRPEMTLQYVCDTDAQRRESVGRRHPDALVTESFDRVLVDPDVDAVLIATPPGTHFELARRALEAGKHVLVEKPLTTRVEDAEELIALAEREGLVVMPGHTFLYSPRVVKVRDLMDDGVIGVPSFVSSSRMNLGLYQRDGVVCDLAPHDLSILAYWLESPVVQVAATGCSVLQDGVPETAFITLSYASGATANLQVSWLAPRKMRQMIVVGSQRMITYDDTSAEEPVRVYDRGMEFASAPSNFGEYQLTYRTGDVVSPRIDAHEPLSLELEDFARAIREGVQPRSHAGLGLEVVRVLEAAGRSMQAGGVPLAVQDETPGAPWWPVGRHLAAVPDGQAA